MLGVDGSGKRILTFRGHFGIAGRDTPVYERFFAGNFGSLRGFQYRGVGPHVYGKNVGGILEGLGSVEYQFPWLANDMLHQVVFADFGSVESDYKFSDVRVSVGTGVRVVIPAFGPLPLCFDLAFPIEPDSVFLERCDDLGTSFDERHVVMLCQMPAEERADRARADDAYVHSSHASNNTDSAAVIPRES